MGGRGTEQDPLVAESRQLVRWRQDGARRRGVACLVTCCPNPDCDCRELHIHAFEVDDRFEEITVRGEEIMVLHRVEPGGPPPPAGHALALLDLETGRLKDAEADPARAQEPGLIEELREMVDADTLEELRADYQRFKDRARERAAEVSLDATWRERDWTMWDGEQPVAWKEVADAPPDTYGMAGGSFEAVDLYCIRPGCECEEVEVDFSWAGGDEDAPMIGAVYVDGPSGEVVGTSNEVGAAAAGSPVGGLRGAPRHGGADASLVAGATHRSSAPRPAPRAAPGQDRAARAARRAQRSVSLREREEVQEVLPGQDVARVLGEIRWFLMGTSARPRPRATSSIAAGGIAQDTVRGRAPRGGRQPVGRTSRYSSAGSWRASRPPAGVRGLPSGSSRSASWRTCWNSLRVLGCSVAIRIAVTCGVRRVPPSGAQLGFARSSQAAKNPARKGFLVAAGIGPPSSRDAVVRRRPSRWGGIEYRPAVATCVMASESIWPSAASTISSTFSPGTGGNSAGA